MNIHELSTYNLGDAVKFHRRLNPRIWGRDEHLLPEVREKLLAIAEDFQEFLGVEDLNIQDITLSGSNAAYSYTKNSDIDLHLVVNMPDNPVYQELFNAKKYQYNDEHNIKIGGADVELYVQPSDQAHHSQGIYSITNNNWLQVPQRKRAQVDDACVRDKVADLDARIHSAVKSKNIEAIGTLWNKIKAMRKSGLEQHGEFGCENISFKMLRNSGCIKLLKDAMMAAQDRELSLREADKPHQRFRYGFSEGMQSQPYSTSDGVAASTKQFLEDSTDDNIVQDFIQHVTTELGIDPVPKIHLHTDPAWSEQNHSFGRYDPDSHTLNVSMPNRHVMDVLRTVAHELVHCSQNQQHGRLPDDAGETGSRWENDANARAGVIMRDWANSHPEHFAQDALEEGASGYIPKNKKEAAMPQYAMALSVDIKPGQTGKEANKLALKTGRNGEPGLLMKTANLREYKMPQPSQGPGRYRDLNEPLGPETPPKMPSGTIKVDVSDTQDWYQLGQDISNLDIANKAHYNQGPPHTVLAFGSEDLEHMYIRQLKKLGLNTHDLDEPGEEDMDESVGDRPGDPTSNREFVSNKYLVKFTPTEMLIYKGGELVYRRNGDYADLKRSDVYMAKSLTSTLWNKDQKGLIPNLEFAGAEKDLLDQYRKFEELKHASPLYSPERTKYERKSLQITRRLKELRTTQGEWKPKAALNEVAIDADQVLQYVKKIHAPEPFNIEYSITDHPAWELKNIPISQLNLDPDGEQQDPYNRTNWVDYDVVNDLMPKISQVLKSKPIVVDSDGWIIDGNHRAMAAAEAGLTSVPALVPAQQGMAEARKNPEQNTKYQSGWAELAAWTRKNNVWLKPHEWAISMTYVPKLGINPGPGISEDTPRGIYFYPFQWAYSVKMDKEALPWADNAPYIQLFQYSTGTELYDPNQIPLASAVAQLKNYGITDEDIAAEKENDPSISTYNLLVWCLGRKYDDNKRVTILNKVLRNLGYDYMIDNGKGWIAINEPTQGVVLNPKIIDKVVTFNNYTRKKEQGVAEAPLADYQPIGDFDKPGPFRGADKKLIPHPVNQLKAQRFFEKTPYNFRLFFSNIPGTGKYSEYGIMDPDTVKIIFGDAGEQIVAGHENAITVVYVGNSGDSKVMLTPWMMAHRLGHAIQVGARGQMRNQQQPWKAGEDHFFGQVNSMLEEYYGKSGQPGGNLKVELTPEYNALFNAMGTQRSSRSGEIRRPYEFLYEIFAQYLGTGTVTFNALPANLGYGRRVWGNPSRYLNIKPEYRDETVRKQAAEVLSYDMELMFNDALSNVEGKILVM